MFALSPFSRCSQTQYHVTDLTFKWVKVKYKYANRRSIHDFLSDGNSYIFPIYHHWPHIHNKNVHDFDLDLYNGNGPRWKVAMQIESPTMTFYIIAIVMCIIFVTLYDVFAIEVCLTLTMNLTFRMVSPPHLIAPHFTAYHFTALHITALHLTAHLF